jgi:hypothetical protein
LKRIIIISVLISLIAVTFLIYGSAVQEATANRVAAVRLWAENVPETAEFYVMLLGLPEQSIVSFQINLDSL